MGIDPVEPAAVSVYGCVIHANGEAWSLRFPAGYIQANLLRGVESTEGGLEYRTCCRRRPMVLKRCKGGTDVRYVGLYMF